MKKINSSKTIYFLLLAIIFAFMLLCNCLTPMLADDFSYSFSFSSGERLKNIFDLFPSIYAHGQKLNGRLVAHFFVQLFLLFPKILFNIVNTGIFTLQIYLIYKISSSSSESKSINNILIISVFCLIYVFQLDFGQVYLWLDGACNYLWASCFGFLFLFPFASDYLGTPKKRKFVFLILFPIFSFFFGAYSENGSPAFVAIAVMIMLFTVIFDRRRPEIYKIISVVTAFIGYLTIYLSPAQMKKSTDFQLCTLRLNFVTCTDMLKQYWGLLALFLALLVLAIAVKADKKALSLSVFLALGALLSNYMLIFAKYYSGRSSVFVATLFVCAISILIRCLENKQFYICFLVFIAVFMLPTSYNLITGLNDIYDTNGQIVSNENYIYKCKENGVEDITLPLINHRTKYSAVTGLTYLDANDANAWPNTSLAEYYEVKSIIGKRW